jgi:hypothetical protein
MICGGWCKYISLRQDLDRWAVETTGPLSLVSQASLDVGIDLNTDVCLVEKQATRC